MVIFCVFLCIKLNMMLLFTCIDIYSISVTAAVNNNNNNNNAIFGFPSGRHDAQIGISLEPLSQLELQVPDEKASVSSLDSYVEFCTKMLDNFVY